MRTTYEVHYADDHGVWHKYDEYTTMYGALKVSWFLRNQGNKTKIVERP